MKKSYLIMAAIASLALVSCSDEEFTGNPELGPGQGTGAIAFASIGKGMTRADAYGADAANLLDNKFIVAGYKHDDTKYNTVFDHYLIQWEANTAGTSTDNTSDWKYVDVTTPALGSVVSGSQTIKYWDYAASYYDFVAFSGGKATLIYTGDASTGNVLATAVNTGTLTTAAYTLTGAAEDLQKCYIADMITATKAGTAPNKKYGDEVTFAFRSLGSKVRIALYETVPGYSVQNVKFYTNNTTTIETGTSEDKATLFAGSGNPFSTSGKMTIKFPTIGSTNTSNSDYNKAHVSFEGSGTTTSTKEFGTLNYTTTKEDARIANGSYLQRTSNNPSFAGTTSPYYITVLPDENGNVLELRVDYELVSIDGSAEVIKVHGATAYVPAIYAAWLPNYAYTYIFKISDNTNGWTSTVTSDPAGLYPITFDAVVLETEDNTQSTITTVATPSITTYQRGHVYSASNEYLKPAKPNDEAAKDNDAIYAQVMQDGTLKTDLNGSGKSFFYIITGNPGTKYSAQPSDWPTGYYTDADCTTPASGTFSSETKYYKSCTEADVMDALNIQESATNGVITGRNGIILTPATADFTVTKIPGEDGNWITKYGSGENNNIAAGMVAKLSPAAAGTYAYVYDYTTGTPTGSPIYTAVKYTSAPSDFGTAGIYYEDPNGAKDVTASPAATFSADTYYYKKYTNQKKAYAVKVIKVASGS